MKKISIYLIVFASIVVLACIIISVLPKKYTIIKDKWEETPYVVLNYGKCLGNYWGNGTYSYYPIKGLSTDEWIFEGHVSIVPINSYRGTVYKKKGNNVEPIKQWNVSKILITHSSDIQQGKQNYVIDNQITDTKQILILLDALNDNSEENIAGLKMLDLSLLFVFDENPSLAWKCHVFRSEDMQYFIEADHNYYSAECLKNYLSIY